MTDEEIVVKLRDFLEDVIDAEILKDHVTLDDAVRFICNLFGRRDLLKFIKMADE
jgi:hypothetical protein